MTPNDVKLRLYDYMLVLQQDCPDYMNVEIEEGRRYYKINVNHSQRVVHSFVDKYTGDVYKPAGRNGPAKGPRYNLFADWDSLKERVDWAGGYLYR